MTAIKINGIVLTLEPLFVVYKTIQTNWPQIFETDGRNNVQQGDKVDLMQFECLIKFITTYEKFRVMVMAGVFKADFYIRLGLFFPWANKSYARGLQTVQILAVRASGCCLTTGIALQ